MPAVDDRLAGVVDHVGDLVSARAAYAGDEARERARDVVEGVVVVVAHDHPPRVAQPLPGAPMRGSSIVWLTSAEG